MTKISFHLLFVGLLLGSAIAAVAESDANKTKNQMIIKIGQETFTATLEDNATAAAFMAMLPLTLKMEDVNANEKVSGLPTKLPTSDANPKRIEAGDLMIWTSRSLVLFYKSFPTAYSYTRLGRIDDAAGLAAAVGSGNLTITFELN
jgi:hypothetical protein